MVTTTLFDAAGEPLPDAEIVAPPDHGCPDLARFDQRFTTCTSCPLPRCKDEYAPHERRAVQAAIRHAVAGTVPGKGRAGRTLAAALGDAITPR